MSSNKTIREPDIHERRFRSAPKVWQSIIKAIYADNYDGRPISYHDLEHQMEIAGHLITRDSLRVKIARYKKSGYVRSAPKRATFWITHSGLQFFGIEPRSTPQQTTAVLLTPPSKWSRKALKINQADATAR